MGHYSFSTLSRVEVVTDSSVCYPAWSNNGWRSFIPRASVDVPAANRVEAVYVDVPGSLHSIATLDDWMRVPIVEFLRAHLKVVAPRGFCPPAEIRNYGLASIRNPRNSGSQHARALVPGLAGFRGVHRAGRSGRRGVFTSPDRHTRRGPTSDQDSGQMTRRLFACNRCHRVP